MPTDRPPGAGTRGPVAREPTLAPSGFRISERTKFELVIAMPYVGATTLQGVLDVAVSEFLQGMRETRGFKAAVRSAEAERQRRGIPVPERGE